jgi:hypothetical protein
LPDKGFAAGLDGSPYFAKATGLADLPRFAEAAGLVDLLYFAKVVEYLLYELVGY